MSKGKVGASAPKQYDQQHHAADDRPAPRGVAPLLPRYLLPALLLPALRLISNWHTARYPLYSYHRVVMSQRRP